jgi:tetratricopeptide (TPR) repeat protein
MKRLSFTIVALCAIILVSCHPNRSKELTQIQQYEDSLLHNAAQVIIDTNLGNQTVALYLQFANDFPNDSLTPGFIYKAADISFNMGKYPAALDYFNRIIDNYAEYSDLGTCYFMVGETYNCMSQYEQAKEAYQQFIELFPDHPLAKDIRYQLEHNMVGMSPEEMLSVVMENAAVADAVL